ncbi:MAG: DUF4159 domain-containing protein [Acidobacteria bacterium]|nr:DUF4159 domain-containing protein [Acidobacteriota bacterium]
MHQLLRRLRTPLLLAVTLAALATTVSAQFQGGRGFRGGRGGGRGFGYRGIPANPQYDGAFMFCRVMFRNASDGDGAGWSVDWPRADENLSFRFSELTRTIVSRDALGNYNHVLLQLTDAALLGKCPFIMLTEPGGAYFDEAEAAGLRTYLQKGGFLWADDFWGEYAWAHWENEIRKALPSGEYPLIEVPLEHPMFHTLYDVKEKVQIPSINFWYGTGGGTSERGRDSAVPHTRAITDKAGHVLVVMTHNTDFGDAFEREGDSREYFERFAGGGYAFGVDVLIYALTH